MKRALLSVLTLFMLLCCPVSYLVAATGSAVMVSSEQLIKALQSGGYIIYMRHGPTVHEQKDRERRQLMDCSKQRNLSPEGRELVKAIGKSIQSLNIPIGKVFSSPYCRCKDTARLVFGDYEVEPDLGFSISKDREESQYLSKRLYDMMMNSPTSGKNTVFVGHTSNLKDGLGIWPKPEGVVVVFQQQENRIVFQGLLKPDDWFSTVVNKER